MFYTLIENIMTYSLNKQSHENFLFKQLDYYYGMK